MPRVTVNGVDLHFAELGRGEPLVLLHGFTGSGGQWLPFARAMAGERRCVVLDLLGHGSSDAPADSARYTMAHCIADLTAVLDHLRIERTDLLGYSMGGRVALAFAVARAERVAALVLEGASAGIADDVQRHDRRRRDARWADLIEREGIEAFADAWMEQPLFASQTRLGAMRLAAERRRRCANDPIGLANNLRGLGAGAQDPLWERLREVSAPTLLVAGQEDEKFRGIAIAMLSRMSCAEVRFIPEAGHAVHLENPAAFESVVRDFVRRNDARSRLSRVGEGQPRV